MKNHSSSFSYPEMSLYQSSDLSLSHYLACQQFCSFSMLSQLPTFTKQAMIDIPSVIHHKLYIFSQGMIDVPQ